MSRISALEQGLPVGRSVDEELSKAGRSFDFLFLVTPANLDAAWEEFRGAGFRNQPALEYQPLPFDPDLLKSQLYRLPIEKTEEPLLVQIFRAKQEELDLEISMLRHRGSRRFFYGSLQRYGEPDDDLQQAARLLLTELGRRSEPEPEETIDGEELAAAARQEIARYRERYDEFRAEVELQPSGSGSLMVCGHRLLVPAGAVFSRRRVEPLLCHEVGTHLLTYFNGSAQPLRLMCGGTAGYDPVQEGLAVLSEFLVGGLNRNRLRLLAARVLATARLVERSAFAETFAFLVDELGFAEKPAFQITVRVYRGGGLTKDMIYLRGLQRVVGFLGNDGDLERLLVGKISLAEVADFDQLEALGLVRAPAVLPFYLERPECRRRLEQVRQGPSLFTLASEARH